MTLNTYDNIFGNWCALQCIHLWEPTHLVVDYLSCKRYDLEDRTHAYNEAQAHINYPTWKDSGSVRWKAAYSSVHACFGGETRGACYKSASALVNSTITTDETIEHRQNLVDAKVTEMYETRHKSRELVEAIKTNSLSARLLDTVIDNCDYVILMLRAGKCQDLQVWEDWYAHIKKGVSLTLPTNVVGNSSYSVFYSL